MRRPERIWKSEWGLLWAWRRWEHCWVGGAWTRLRCGGGCTERRRYGNENGGTRCGCWRRVGRQRRCPMRWNGMPIRLAYGPGHSRRVAPRRWFLNRVVVPPALDVEQRAELKAAVPVSPSQAGIDLSNWNWKVVRRFCCAIGWVSQSSQGTLRTNTILSRRVYTLLSSERWEKAWGQPYRTLSRG